MVAVDRCLSKTAPAETPRVKIRGRGGCIKMITYAAHIVMVVHVLAMAWCRGIKRLLRCTTCASPRRLFHTSLAPKAQ